MRMIPSSLRVLLFVILVVCLVPLTLAADPYKVIVNSAVNIDGMPKKAVSDLFMKRTPRWQTGTAVVPVDQTEASAVRGEFSKSVHGKPAAAVKSYWNQQIFAGRDVPPVEKASDAEVIAFVRSTPGAVGYVSSSAVTDGVRVLAVR